MNREREITRERQRDRDRNPYARQLETLKDLGKFRLVNVDDLAEHRYRGDRATMQADLAKLAAPGSAMIQLRTVVDRKTNERIELAVLTAKGKAFVHSHHPSQAVYDGQKLFDGFVRPKEIFHDAKFYPAYQAAALKIEAAGGTVQRVVLDHELKGIKARLTNQRHPVEGKPGELGNENSALTLSQKEAIAKDLKLKVTAVKRHGETQYKIMIPDVRIEYKDRNGKEQIRDLEIVTSSYRDADRKAKVAAGFTIASGSGSIARPGSAVYSDRLWE